MAKKRNLIMWLVMAVFWVGMAPAIAAGGTIYVDADASPGGDGTSWATAYKYLQDALNKPPTGGDEIWVAGGVYKPDEDEGGNVTPGDRTATFQLINGVALYGGFAGGESSLDERNWRTNETILSGDLNGDDVGFSNNGENSYQVVTGSGTNSTAVLDGFTVTAGNANGGWEGPTNAGGGMFNESGSPTVRNCTFSGNSASSLAGGGMANWGSSPTVTNCTFSGNSASGGGGMYNRDNSNPTIINCTFSGNSAGSNGGGMLNGVSSPTVTNCTFSGNSAYVGGGMYNDEYDGYGSNPTLTNCILWGNTALSGAEIYCEGASFATVSYSDVQGSWPGTGNIDEDPLFIGPNGLDGIPGTADDEEGNVHLRGYSPCINAGDPSGNYTGQVDIDNQPRVAYGRVDMGADEVFPAAGDFEPDGDVDFADFARFAGNWLLGL